MNKNYLLPYKLRWQGWIILTIGVLLSVLYIVFDFRFMMPVFAVFSSFFETKYFATFKTNFADEATMIFLFAGLFLVAFTKEKNESGFDQNLNNLRGAALIKSIYINSIILLFSILFVYGQGFLFIMIFNLFSCLILYIIIFRIMLKKNETALKNRNNNNE